MPKFVPPSKEELARRGVGVEPVKAEAPKRRARKEKGQFQADDPKTPENEAWEEIKE